MCKMFCKLLISFAAPVVTLIGRKNKRTFFDQLDFARFHGNLIIPRLLKITKHVKRLFNFSTYNACIVQIRARKWKCKFIKLILFFTICCKVELFYLCLKCFVPRYHSGSVTQKYPFNSANE